MSILEIIKNIILSILIIGGFCSFLSFVSCIMFWCLDRIFNNLEKDYRESVSCTSRDNLAKSDKKSRD